MLKNSAQGANRSRNGTGADLAHRGIFTFWVIRLLIKVHVAWTFDVRGKSVGTKALFRIRIDVINRRTVRVDRAQFIFSYMCG